LLDLRGVDHLFGDDQDLLFHVGFPAALGALCVVRLVLALGLGRRFVGVLGGEQEVCVEVVLRVPGGVLCCLGIRLPVLLSSRRRVCSVPQYLFEFRRYSSVCHQALRRTERLDRLDRGDADRMAGHVFLNESGPVLRRVPIQEVDCRPVDPLPGSPLLLWRLIRVSIEDLGEIDISRVVICLILVDELLPQVGFDGVMVIFVRLGILVEHFRGNVDDAFPTVYVEANGSGSVTRAPLLLAGGKLSVVIRQEPRASRER
jgi:hypothetical protein